MRSKIWWVPAAISGLVATTHRTLATGPGGLAVTFDRPDPGKGETCIRLAAYPARRADPALEPPRLAHTLPHQDPGCSAATEAYETRPAQLQVLGAARAVPAGWWASLLDPRCLLAAVDRGDAGIAGRLEERHGAFGEVASLT